METARPPTPLWVKLFGVAAVVVFALVAVLLLMDTGHGPGQHL